MSYLYPQPANPKDDYFCALWVEVPGDEWAGTFCKLPAGHEGPCSAHYPPETGAPKDPRG